MPVRRLPLAIRDFALCENTDKMIAPVTESTSCMTDAQVVASIDEVITECSLDSEFSNLRTTRWFDFLSGLVKCQKMDNRLDRTVRAVMARKITVWDLRFDASVMKREI